MEPVAPVKPWPLRPHTHVIDARGNVFPRHATKGLRTMAAATIERRGPSPALVHANREIERLKGIASRLRAGLDRESDDLMNVGIAATAAYVAGAYDRSIGSGGRTAPATVGGLDWRLTWGVGAHLASKHISGSTGRLLRHASIGLVCSGATAAGASSRMFTQSSGGRTTP